MSHPISRLTGGALALTGAVLAISAVAVVLLFSSGGAAAATRPSANTLARTTISARHTSVGTVLVGPGGKTVYAFSRDHLREDSCAAVKGCLTVWPLLTTHGSVSAGPGVKRSLLSTITVHGTHQITYAGHPLYGYENNGGPGDTSYVGISQFGGSWPAVSPSGSLVR